MISLSLMLRVPARPLAWSLPLLALACSEAPRPAPAPPGPPKVASPSTAAPAAPASASAAVASTAAPSASAAAAPTAAPTTTAAPALAAGTRIWGKSRFTWIHPSPFVSNAWTGYIGLGGSAPLKGGSLESARVAAGAGRCAAWYAVEPTGFVCEGETASVDPADPLTAALIREAGNPQSPWPFEYGESMNAPRYPRIPTVAEMRKTEWDLAAHMAKVARARAAATPEELAAIDKEFAGMDFTPAGVPAPTLPEVSVFVRESRRFVVKGSTIAYVRAFDVDYPDGEGFTRRTFLLTADHAIVPKDRVRPYPKSQFKGVALGDDVRLPIAFFRKTPRPKYTRGPDGAMVPTGDSWPARSYTMVTGEEVTVGKDRFVATREQGIFARAEDATVIPLAAPPSGKILEAPGRGTWLDISVLGGWLVAYEKTKPVFATLISPGRGGVPFPGLDPLATASTPLGNFRVDGKFVWASMVSSSNSDIVHAEVQFVQNFHGPHALHGAYWHDSFGEPKSGGCINLSPIDSKWLFEFTEPALPEGWHGLRSTHHAGYATIVSVHR